MRLSEAISLGHTLIGEKFSAFYYQDTDPDGNPCRPCGCAIGSAIAALGEGEEYIRRETADASSFDGIVWCEERFPWTARPVSDFAAMAAAFPELSHFTVAHAISCLHVNGDLSRLKIAALIAQIEPDSPQPGPAPSSPSSSMPAPVTSGVSR